MNNIDFNKIQSVYFIGIGGIGISAIARMMLLNGKEVSGSDASESPVTEELISLGAKINIGQREKNINNNFDLVIYSIAVPPNNSELAKAREIGLAIMSYPEVLSEITKKYFTVAVSGTHGKTTTTAMLAKILVDAGLDPTVIVGSLLNGSRTNFISGRSNILVLEADEYRRTFLQISPRVIIVTNIEIDHLDYYKDLADIKSAFRSFTTKLGRSDYLVCDTTMENLKDVYSDLGCKIINFREISRPDLLVPGEHNRDDARAAVAAATVFDVSVSAAKKSLENFPGTWRRLEKRGELISGAIVYDDYAHNPGKIQASILGLRELYPDKKITIVFMPHLFSRTKILLNEIADSLLLADKIYVTDIYAARELPDPSIHARDLVASINVRKNIACYLPNLESFVENIKNELNSKDLLVTMGAGDIYKLADKVIE